MAVAAVGLFLVGYQWGNQYQRTQEGPPQIAGVLLSPSVALPEIALQGPRGPFATDERETPWSLLAFGRPTSARGHRGVARLIAVWNRTADQPDLREQLRLLLVSADDIPALARDLERLTPNLFVLSTSQAELGRLRQAMGASGDAQEDGDDLPPTLFLIGPQARLVALFPGSQPAAQIAEDLGRLAERPDAFTSAPLRDDG
ncbi:MAG: hypothetical protein GVY22_14415 [Gammaproteobacteria bacterium]|jgi:hypothetical protein|nr:hypothetical protein [Gammaproteobacteria bacterium]